MSDQSFDPAALRKVGMIQQKQTEYFALRLHAVIGNFTSAEIRKVAEVADRYGRSQVHLSTRQGIEIHFVHQDHLEEARRELESAGIVMGACGPRVRIVAGCPGSATCSWGIIETEEVAEHLDRAYFREDTPYKFKLAVTGCPHNCAKATENDIGIMGGMEPVWDRTACSGCTLCINICPTRAITNVDDKYVVDYSKCINCSVCTASCPTEAWKPGKQGFILWLGGTLGKTPRLATKFPELVESKERLYELIDNAIAYYQKHGRKKERFGFTLDRMGLDEALKKIANGVS